MRKKKTYQVMCPDCGGVLTEGTDYRALLGKTHTCDGPHDEDVTFKVRSKDVMIKREKTDKKYYNKLVRDRIPEVLTNQGVEYKTHVAVIEDEYRSALHHKIKEEVQEFIDNPCPEELGDILEVLDYVRKNHNFTLEEIKTEMNGKRHERGGFNKKIILEWTKENNGEVVCKDLINLIFLEYELNGK